ncbi:-trans-enoyl-mitochondrial precursor [Plasmopara halstedii]|uniref:Enoyl-CoA delta isomerase 1, mitochondrial n=1 Tax=Plasmopara halstedii TaxID=4781 RepID=A0A0P1AC84_PLAHL|nr:-trans-enoyl-mitochondrial precursor [Plasmopara halstedii]CEG38231.1 -trans-enoyl-mitochondrial precursor [Plasmopara halstedii]|eukprot:XP_024574600.1 -trans-enoyl-mitochondrial precursor [Plasmopara halstedii]
MKSTLLRIPRLGFQTARFSSSATDPLVLVEKKDKYAIVRMNRPPVNSLNTPLLKELDATIKKLEDDKSVRGVILASSNPKIFSAGLDLMEMYRPQLAKMSTFWTSLQDLYLRLYTTRLAAVAAIEGHSPAGGCLLAMCCDYRIMTSGKPMIGLNETQLGIVAPSWFRDTFVNTIGHREAEKMLGLGLQVDANKAKAIGLVDEAVAFEEVFPRAEGAMAKWLAIPDMARVKTKLQMRQETADRLIATREKDLEAFTDFAQTDKVQKSLEMYLATLKSKA